MLTWIADENGKRQFRRDVVDATAAIIGDTEMHEASHSWWRQTPEEIAEHKDGLTMDMLGEGATVTAIAKSAAPPDLQQVGEFWLEATKGQQTTGSAFVMLSSTDLQEPAQLLDVGRHYQRMHLWATSVGLAMHPLNQILER